MTSELQMVENGGTWSAHNEMQPVVTELDDDGRPKRTGTFGTASAHIITAVIGSGVLSLAWATAQLGWLAGPGSLVIFSAITFYTSNLLADCYRTGDPILGKRNYSYVEAVKSSLGKTQVWLCLICQYTNLYGTSIGYTITAAISAGAMHKSYCLRKRSEAANCKISDSPYMIGFGILQIFMSQLPKFHDLWFVSILAAVMSFSYSSIVVGFSLARVISGTHKTTLTGTEVGVDLDASQKIWVVLQALGNIAFAYSFSLILVEIQDTLKSTPPENKTMKKAVSISLSITTAFYLLCGCLGYAAFGNSAPGNILTGFGLYEPLWLVNIAHVCIIVHLVGAYQVFSQPIFSMVESCLAKQYPYLINSSKTLQIGGKFKVNINIFMITWRTFFVVTTTVLAIAMPFFNDIVGFLGAIGFWPMTIYFPIEMYIKCRRIRVLSAKWIWMQSLSAVCFIISVSSVCASVQGIVKSLKSYTPFDNLL